MIIPRFVFGFALFAAISSMAPAYAACGSGRVPGYGDISSVRYEKTACYGVCPSYAVSFSPALFTYDGRSNVARLGTYESSETAKFKDVVALLAKFDFYSFKVKPGFVTDVPHFIVELSAAAVPRKSTGPRWGGRVFQEVTACESSSTVSIALRIASRGIRRRRRDA
jgi:hypothetical protein